MNILYFLLINLAYLSVIAYLLLKRKTSKSAKQEFKTMDTVFDELLNTIPDMISIHDKDMNIIYSNWNGYGAVDDKKRIIGSKCYKTYRGYDSICPNCKAVSVFDSGKKYRSEAEVADGKYVDLSIIPLKDKNGDTRFIVEWVRDISIEKKIEKDLKLSEKKYRLLFENLIAGFALHEMIYDKDGKPVDYKYLEVNKAFEKLTGAKAESMVGHTVKEMLPDTEDYWIETYAKVARTGESISYQNFSQEIGKHFDVWAFSPEKDKFAVVFIDITDRKRAEELVLAKNKELEQIVYVASHDLRSPLVNVEGYGKELEYSLSDMMKFFKSDNLDLDLNKNEIENLFNEMIEDIKHIRNSARQMDDLLKGLLKLSRIGRAALNIQKISVGNLLKNVISAMDFQLQENSVELLVESLPDCLADEFQLTQVFNNLIGNAIKYKSPDRKCKIKISGEISGHFSVYCVEDNGIGICKAHQDKIFELFHRLNPSNTEGDGLGLTIVRQIVGRLEGEIYVESDEGLGSKFFIKLPVSK